MSGQPQSFDAPQYMPSPSPRHWLSMATISAGLHVHEEWCQLPQSSLPPLSDGSASGPAPAWVQDKIADLVKTYYSDERLDRVLSALYEQDLQGLEHKGCCSCGGQQSPTPQALNGSCSWCRAKSKLGNVKQIRDALKRVLSNAGRHLRSHKNPESPISGSSPDSSNPAPVSPASSPVLSPKASRFQPPASISYNDTVSELPGDHAFVPQDDPIFRTPFGGLEKAAKPSELSNGMPYDDVSPTLGSKAANGYGSGYSYPARGKIAAPASERSTTLGSTMSESSVASRGRPSLVSLASISTAPTEWTEVSTAQAPLFGEGFVQSPVSTDSSDDVTRWATDQLVGAQGTSASPGGTHVGPSLMPVEGSWDPSVWGATDKIPPSTRLDAFPSNVFLGTTQTHHGLVTSFEPPPAYTVLNQHATWDSNAQQPPVYSPPSIPQPSDAAAEGYGDMTVWSNPLGPQPHLFSHSAASIAHTGNIFDTDHAMDLIQPAAVTPMLRMPISLTTLVNAEFLGLQLPTYGQMSSAMNAVESGDFNAERETWGAQMPPPAVEALPSVRRRRQAGRPTGLRRSLGQSYRTESCCGVEFRSPGIKKKLKRHRESDGHRRQNDQVVVDRQVCDNLNDDGSICGKRFGRIDNLRQHRRKEHGEALLRLPSSRGRTRPY